MLKSTLANSNLSAHPASVPIAHLQFPINLVSCLWEPLPQLQWSSPSSSSSPHLFPPMSSLCFEIRQQSKRNKEIEVPLHFPKEHPCCFYNGVVLLLTSLFQTTLLPYFKTAAEQRWRKLAGSRWSESDQRGSIYRSAMWASLSHGCSSPTNKYTQKFVIKFMFQLSPMSWKHPKTLLFCMALALCFTTD